MKKYNEFLNEGHKKKFDLDDFAKRKKDGRIGKVEGFDYEYYMEPERFPTLLYEIDFGDSLKKYSASKLEIPTEIELMANKYNI